MLPDPLTALALAHDRHRDLVRTARAERARVRGPRMRLPRLRRPVHRPVLVPCTTC